MFIWVLAGNRWFIQTTQQSQSKGLFAKMWARLRQAARNATEPLGSQHWDILAPLGLEEDGEAKLCCRGRAETGTHGHEEGATASSNTCLHLLPLPPPSPSMASCWNITKPGRSWSPEEAIQRPACQGHSAGGKRQRMGSEE